MIETIVLIVSAICIVIMTVLYIKSTITLIELEKQCMNDNEGLFKYNKIEEEQ